MLRNNATCLGLNITQCFLEIACVSMRDPNLGNSWGEWVSLALPVSSGRYSTTVYNLRRSSLGLQINSSVWAKNIVGWPCKRQNLSLSWGRVIGISPLLWMTLIAHLVLLCLLFFLAVIVLGCYITNCYKCIGLMQHKLLMPLFLYGRIFGA